MKVSKIIINLYTLLFLLVAFCGAEKMVVFGYTAELMALMGVLLLVGHFVSKKEFGASTNKAPIFLFFLILIFSIIDYMIWTIYPECTFSMVKRFVFYIPSFLVCISIDSIERIINVSKLYMIAIAIGFIILYPVKGVNGSFLGSYQNVAGALSVGLLFYSIDFLFKEKYEKKDIVKFLFIIGTLLMTGKRTFTVIPIVTMVVLTFCRIGNVTVKTKLRRLLKILIPAVALGTIILVIKPDILLAVSRLLETTEDAGMNGRKNFWELALYLWSENKWLGIGLGTYQEFIARNMEFMTLVFKIQAAYAAHNIYFQLLAEVGLIGMLLFVLFFVYNLFDIVKLTRNRFVKNNSKILKYAYLSLIIQIWFLVYGSTGNPLYMVNQLYIYVFAIMINQAIRREIIYSRKK